MPYKDKKMKQLNNKTTYEKNKLNSEWKKRKENYNKHYRFHIRLDLMEILGGSMCIFCGYSSDIRALQIDHKYGTGPKDRERFKSNYKMYRYYRDHPEEAKGKLQVLCANCNAIKKINNQEY